MELGRGKKAISPVVATVLLIAMGIIVVAIIFIWARGSIGDVDSKFNTPLDQACSGLSLDVSISLGGRVDVVNRESQFAIEDVMLRDSSGELTACGLGAISPGDSGSKSCAPNDVEAVIPVLKGDGGERYNCVDNEITNF
tara:strand:+ start:407 stop:826 length:420 start_codon:yes stop_codon:yes gene_type:complete